MLQNARTLAIVAVDTVENGLNSEEVKIKNVTLMKLFSLVISSPAEMPPTAGKLDPRDTETRASP